jgi:antitoxin MazE
MKTRVQKWGNSVAVRIPKSVAAEARINQDAVVELSLADGILQVTPVGQPSFTLESLLKGITDENLHEEIGTGPPTGREAW